MPEERENIRQIEEFKNGFNAVDYVKKCVNMYGGDDCQVVIRFNKALLDKVIDKLGNDITFIPYKNEPEVDKEVYFIARFTAKNSEGLVHWIMQFGSKVRVLELPELVEKIRNEINKLKSEYEEPVR